MRTNTPLRMKKERFAAFGGALALLLASAAAQAGEAWNLKCTGAEGNFEPGSTFPNLSGTLQVDLEQGVVTADLKNRFFSSNAPRARLVLFDRLPIASSEFLRPSRLQLKMNDPSGDFQPSYYELQMDVGADYSTRPPEGSFKVTLEYTYTLDSGERGPMPYEHGQMFSMVCSR